MRTIVLAVLLFTCAVSHAGEFVGGYDYYVAPNEGNNYDDAQGYTFGYEHQIHKDIKGRAEITHITDINFPSVDDPKGYFGELRGYGILYNIITELRYNKHIAIILSLGAGPYFWEFKENPFLQDHNVNVSVDNSIVIKASAEINADLREDWKAFARVGWMDTNIGKEAKDQSGKTWNILDADDNIGLQYIPFSIGIKKRW